MKADWKIVVKMLYALVLTIVSQIHNACFLPQNEAPL